jgi:transcriptional regulator with XRE-family HTH domain
MTTSELGAFLRARRAGLTPYAVGLPDLDGPRKVKGLRREEVAQLAAISVDYYIRLEQGRVQASASVLATPFDSAGIPWPPISTFPKKQATRRQS